MSAIPLTIASLKSGRHSVEFQLLKPIGGVRARPLASAFAAGAVNRTEPTIPPSASPVAASSATSLRGLRTYVLLQVSAAAAARIARAAEDGAARPET